LEKLVKKLEKSKYSAELFILFKLLLLFLVWIIFFVIFQDSSHNVVLAALSGDNIGKLRKTRSKNVWNELTVNFGSKVFTTSLFKSKFNKFWKEIEDGFTHNNHLFILLKIKYNNGEFVTIGKLQKLNLSDKNWYINWIIDNMEFKSEYYNETLIDSIILSYGFKTGRTAAKEKRKLNVNYVILNEMKLPISTNPLDFGKLIKQLDNNYFLQYEKGITITINKSDDNNDIEFFKNGNSLIKFQDQIISENKFIRVIDNKKYYFENGEQFVMTKELKTEFIPKTRKSNKLVNNFITLDIETFVKNNILTPFCVSIYDGKIVSSFYLTDYKNVDEMVLSALSSIMIRKYNGYNVYMHNMAKFDMIFLFKYLIKLGKVKPIIHHNRLISVDLNFGGYQLKFRDSLLLLLNSLNKLSKSFKIDNSKTVFPIFFVNENNLNYIGEVPDIKHFKDINLNEYGNYKTKFNGNWNLKIEAIKYCNLDCISLHQVLTKFNKMIFDLFGQNVHHYRTLPSLAFAIFRSNFMKEDLIPRLSGKIAKDIRQGYTGGAVDMYIPQSKPGVKIKCYDVNALYPSQMQAQLMPVGYPTYFIGDITLLNPDSFGFFYCEIIAPDDIKHPILQTHVKTNKGIRTISPIGQWEDMLFSEEVLNARKNGYIINILWGYTFKKENIFKNYVDLLHNLRKTYPKTDPMNFIAKILLNSLYGRFGMDDNFANINVIHKDYYGDFENKYFDNIIEKIKLDDHWIVFYNTDNIEDIATHNVSISIAAAITAYSRIHMSQFKNNPKINLYYTDTDSAYTDSNIDDSFIHATNLGKLKLEHVADKAIFLTPKVYCLDTQENGLNYSLIILSLLILYAFVDTNFLKRYLIKLDRVYDLIHVYR